MTFESPQQNPESKSGPKRVPSPEMRSGLMEAGSAEFYGGKRQVVGAVRSIDQADSITKAQIADTFFPRENAGTEDINLRAAFEALVEERGLSWGEFKNTKSKAKEAIQAVTKRYLEFWRTTDGSPTERNKRKDEIRAELQSLVRGGIQ